MRLKTPDISELEDFFYWEFYDSFDPDDKRREGIKARYWNGKEEIDSRATGKPGAFPMKYQENPNTTGQYDASEYVINRYAEVILARAEAINELEGPTREAKDLVHQIRRRAFDRYDEAGNVHKALVENINDQAEFRDHILKERGWEFYWEGMRRPDLIRHGKLIENAQTRGKSFAEDKHILYPIPQSAIYENPNLEQNEDWNYHPEIEKELYDLCIPFRASYPSDVLERRKSEGKVTTFYTCCAEAYPNTFMVSSPYEASWLAWRALASGCDGYLRWAYNSWTAEPEKDARFSTWAAGDCYIVYPGGSSIRMEKLIEGIQDCEKARILSEEWLSSDNEEKVRAFEKVLGNFNFEELRRNGAEKAVKSAKNILCGIL